MILFDSDRKTVFGPFDLKLDAKPTKCLLIFDDEICTKNLSEAILYYNMTYGKAIKSIEDIKDSEDPIFYGEFHNRISFMTESAMKFCLESGEN